MLFLSLASLWWKICFSTVKKSFLKSFLHYKSSILYIVYNLYTIFSDQTFCLSQLPNNWINGFETLQHNLTYHSRAKLRSWNVASLSNYQTISAAFELTNWLAAACIIGEEITIWNTLTFILTLISWNVSIDAIYYCSASRNIHRIEEARICHSKLMKENLYK